MVIGRALLGSFRKLWFNLKYLSRPVWDTDITPPELVELVESGELPAGRVVDLGCGTGTNVIYLARHGFEAVGVDVAWLAIRQARRKARAAGVNAVFRVGDVTDLSFLRHPVDFALDMGCFQGLLPEDQTRYAASLASHSRPGALFLMYAWGAGRQVGLLGEMGVAPDTVARVFAPHFEVCWVRHGEERGSPSAWYLLKRRYHALNSRRCLLAAPCAWVDHPSAPPETRTAALGWRSRGVRRCGDSPGKPAKSVLRRC